MSWDPRSGVGGIHVGLEAPRTAANGVSWHHWGHAGWTPGPRQCHSPQAHVQPAWPVSHLRTHFDGCLGENTLNLGWGYVGSRGCTRSHRTPRFLASHLLCLGLPRRGGGFAEDTARPKSRVSFLSPSHTWVRTEPDPLPFLSPRFQGELDFKGGCGHPGEVSGGALAQ